MPTIYELLQQGPGFVVQFAGVESTSFKALTSTTTLTLADARIADCDPTAGGFSVLLPATPYPGYTIAVRNVSASTNTITIDGNGININGAGTQSIAAAYGCRVIQYVPAAGAQAAQYVMVEGNAAGAAPAAHAASHRAGGSDDLLGAPGAIGGATPAAGNFTDVRLAAGSGGGTASRLSLVTAADLAGLVMFAPDGGAVRYGLIETGSATQSSSKRIMTVSLADDAFVDITTTVGGFASIVAPATADSGGFFSFLANGTPSLNGLTFTTLVAADTDNKLCVFASGGKLRIRNRLGTTQVVMLEITEALSA